VNPRGNIVLALMFALLLAASGLALLTHSGTHLKIVAARRNKRLEAAVLEQALLFRLHRYREQLAAADMNAFAEPESDFFNNTAFPDQEEDGALSRLSFERLPRADSGGFRCTRILGHVQCRQRNGRLEYFGRAGVDLLAGDIPAGEFGLLVAGRGAETAAEFLAGHGVEFAGSQLPLVGDYAVRTETGRLLCETLGLPVEVPNWRRLREKFGLEPIDAPIAPGIYLARDQEKVTAVFVEGDLQELEFSAEGGWQSIVFRRDGCSDVLRYKPGLESLAWSGGEGPAVAGFRFGEKIIVHGSVWDIEQSGAAAFLPASRVELLACGRLVVRSGLVSANLDLAREKFPGLLLMTAARDFFNDEAVESDVVIDIAGAATVQAQIIAAGKLVNGNGSAVITGGLLAADIENAGRLRIDGAAGQFAFGAGALLPDFKFLKNFRVHFIQEGADE
jgi:hypothetical protein